MTQQQKSNAIITGISGLMLIGAYTLEYMFDLRVCHSCWMQRYAWFITLGAATVGLLPLHVVSFLALWIARIALVGVLYYSIEQVLQQYGVINAKICSLQDMILGISCADKGFTIAGLTLATYSAIAGIFTLTISFPKPQKLFKSILQRKHKLQS